MRTQSMRNSNQVLHGALWEENFYTVAAPPALAEIMGDTNAEARSVYGS